MTEQTSTAPSAVLEALRGALARAVRALIAAEEMHMPSGKRQMFTVAIEFGNDALEKHAAVTAAPATTEPHSHNFIKGITGNYRCDFCGELEPATGGGTIEGASDQADPTPQES